MRQPDNNYFDFIIIGGGIAGASIGYHLSQSKQVMLLEQEDAFGFHTTGRSAATYIELLQNQTIVALSRASKAFLSNPPADFAQSAILQACACIVTAKASEQKQLEAVYTLASSMGTQVSTLTLDEIEKLIPIIGKSGNAGRIGVIETQAMRIDVDCLLQGYLRGIKRHGSQTRVRVTIEGISRSDGLWQLETKDSEQVLQTPVIINAAGAWADQVAKLAGVAPIGLTPKRRTMITFDAPTDTDISSWPMLAELDGSFYLLPEAGQLMGSPADETPSPACDAQADELDIATAIYNIEQHTNLRIKKVNHKWAGLRTFARDRLPVIGFDPTAEGFFWLAGQGGFGIQTAPALAQLGAAIALDSNPQQLAQQMNIDLAMILPDRFR